MSWGVRSGNGCKSTHTLFDHIEVGRKVKKRQGDVNVISDSCSKVMHHGSKWRLPHQPLGDLVHFP